MVEGATRFIDWLAANPTMTGLATLFGVLAGIEFTVKYLVKTTWLIKIGVRFGVRGSYKSYRRLIQKNLLHLRHIRGKYSREYFNKLVKSELIYYFASVSGIVLFAISLALLFPIDLPLVIAIVIGILAGRSLQMLGIWLGAKANVSMVEKPELYRRSQIEMLRLLSR